MPQSKTTVSQKPLRQKQTTKTATPRPKRRTGPTPRPAAALDHTPSAPGTKSSIILGLLGRKQGATLAEMMRATHWQAHSVRGFLSGSVKKKLGLPLTSIREGDGVRRYTIEMIDE